MKSRFSIIGFILSFFFGIVAVTFMTAVVKLFTQPFFEIKLIFIFLNILLVMFIASFSGYLCSKISVPMFTTISIITALYTVIQFVGVSLVIFTAEFIGYFILFEMLILFVYLALVLPIGKVGYNSMHRNQNIIHEHHSSVIK